MIVFHEFFHILTLDPKELHMGAVCGLPVSFSKEFRIDSKVKFALERARQSQFGTKLSVNGAPNAASFFEHRGDELEAG